MQFSIAYCIFLCLPKIDYGMYKVLLQNTFQSSMPLLNAFFGLIYVSVKDKWLNIGHPESGISIMTPGYFLSKKGGMSHLYETYKRHF